MAILNYSTSISTDKTYAEIQAKLVKAKASAVMAEFDGSGVLSHVAFRLDTPQGNIAFRLPANVDGVFAALMKAQIPKAKKTKEQAARVAWRIIKDWVEAQVAIIEAGMATTSEVFLPYAQTENGQTVYQRFQKHGLAALTYQGGRNEQ